MLTTTLINPAAARANVAQSAARTDILDLALFAASCVVCAALFFDGGVLGLIAAMLGFIAGWTRAPMPAARLNAAFKTAFAALWAGMMMGGALAIVLTP